MKNTVAITFFLIITILSNVSLSQASLMQNESGISYENKDPDLKVNQKLKSLSILIIQNDKNADKDPEEITLNIDQMIELTFNQNNSTKPEVSKITPLNIFYLYNKVLLG